MIYYDKNRIFLTQEDPVFIVLKGMTPLFFGMGICWKHAFY